MFQLNLISLSEICSSYHINMLYVKQAVWQKATNLARGCTASTLIQPWRWGPVDIYVPKNVALYPRKT